MTTWFTSDLHLGHERISELANRPFASVSEMNDTLIRNWNEDVAHDDTVYVLGDFAMGKIAETLPLVASLNGKKYLLAGNHDRCFYGKPNRLQWMNNYLVAGFYDVLFGTQTLNVAGTLVNASHFPYEGDSHDEDRYVDDRPVDDGRWLLHGHVHEKWRVNGRQINVGVDVNLFRPVHEAEIASIMQRFPSA